MLNTITFKTELSDIMTLEEVVVLLDSVKSKSELEMISLSILPKFNQFRGNIINSAMSQRNAELSQLLMKIAERKQEIKINMWKVLSEIGSNKKKIQNDPSRAEDLEQIIYEEEQIIGTYEQSIKTLERKEQKIMNGRYSRVEKIKGAIKKKTLRKQLQDLFEKLSIISERHDDCFKKELLELTDIIDNSTISSFPKNLNKMAVDSSKTVQSIEISDDEDIEDEIYEETSSSKDYYQYEPDAKSLDDDLIYQLLTQCQHEGEKGSINGMGLSTEAEEV